MTSSFLFSEVLKWEIIEVIPFAGHQAGAARLRHLPPLY